MSFEKMINISKYRNAEIIKTIYTNSSCTTTKITNKTIQFNTIQYNLYHFLTSIANGEAMMVLATAVIKYPPLADTSSTHTVRSRERERETELVIIKLNKQ